MRGLCAVLVAVLAVGCASRRAEVANDRGRQCLTAGDVRCAIREFGAAAKAVPDSPKYRYNLGLALGKARLYDQAVVELSEALRLDPSDAQARRVLAICTEERDADRSDRLARDVVQTFAHR